VAIVIFYIMTTWKKGRAALEEMISNESPEFTGFISSLEKRAILRKTGVQIFLTGNPYRLSRVALHWFKHSGSYADTAIQLAILSKRVPYVNDEERVEITRYEHGFMQIVGYFGFMENPDIMTILECCKNQGLDLGNIDQISFIMGRTTLKMNGKSGLSVLAKKVFELLVWASFDPTKYFGIPPRRALKLEMEIYF
jgi:KUP system potassium uptake protein